MGPYISTLLVSSQGHSSRKYLPIYDNFSPFYLYGNLFLALYGVLPAVLWCLVLLSELEMHRHPGESF